MKESLERHIIPLRAKPRTCPARIMPGPLQLFVRPMQPLTRPFERVFERRYRKAGAWARWLVAFDAVAAAALATMAVIFASVVLLPPPAPLRLSVEASATEVRAADLVGFTVRYENRGKESLTDATLALAYPDGFRITALTVDGAAPLEPLAEHRVIPLGDIGPGGNGAVRISGYPLAHGDLRMHGTLTGARGHTVEARDVEAFVRVSGSALSLHWAGAPHPLVVTNRPAWQALILTNDGDATIPDLLFQDAEIEGGVERRPIAIGPRETIVLGEYVPQSWLMDVIASVGGVDVRLASLGHQELQTNREGPAVDRVLAQVQDGMLEVRSGVSFGGLGLYRLQMRYFPLPWSAVDASRLPDDAEWEGIPGTTSDVGPQKDEVIFTVPLKDGVETSGLTMRVVASSCFVDSDDCAWSSSERVPVAPPGPTLSAELRYYTAEGEQLGRGPLPPRVEEKTEYWLIAQIATAGRSVVDAELSATFAPDVTWAGKASTAIVGAGSPTGIGALRWRIGEVTSSATSPSTAAFAVAYRPRSDAVGRDPVLVESLVLRGRDAETDEPVELRLGPFTTAVPHDARAAEKGTRVEAALE